ncbi:MAG: HlyD family secretion protein [Bacteroidetes bacterium]|nr:HlyD family secretion protein [Bacteroidota bacterium]
MKNKKWILIPLAIVLILIIWYFTGRNEKVNNTIIVAVKKGNFDVKVTTTGELDAKSSQDIYGPDGLRTIGIWQVKISEMIPEGTVVDSGQFVATLDKTEISNKIKDLQTDLEKLESQITRIRLDTTLDLRTARDELINLKFAVEERQITLDQSKYEPPASIRQAEIDLQKSQRNYEQAVQNYKLKHSKAKATIGEITATYDQSKRKYETLMRVLEDFTVKAPKSGMLIYKRDWDGKRQGVGATVNAWNNVVATLPNLSKMISKTYINEIDVSKVKIGQKVEIGVDAFPEKKFTGEVTEVANIGEQMRGTNAKVFEVKILVHEYDSILRPAMTTKNTIITAVVPNVIYVPIESVHTKDSITFVFKDEGSSIVKQQVKAGVSNENEIIITKGLTEKDKVYLLPPENADKLKLIKLP